MATELVELRDHEEESPDFAHDGARVSFNVGRATQRAATRTDSNLCRRSLQTCPVESNEEKLEGLLHHYRNNRFKSRIIEGLLFLLSHLLAPVHESVDVARRAWGFLKFEEAFGIFEGCFDCAVGKDEFQGHLLHPEYGLRVNVAQVNSNRQVIVLIYFKRYVFTIFVVCFVSEILNFKELHFYLFIYLFL